MVKPVDGPKPQQIRTQPRLEVPQSVTTTSVPTQSAPTPDSVFADAKKKLQSITGGHKAHPVKPDLLNGVLYSKVNIASALPTAKAKTPPDVGALLDQGAKMANVTAGEDTPAKDIASTKKDFADAKANIAAGKYGAAYKSLEESLRRGEDVVKAMGGDAAVKSTETVRDQVQFLAKMEAAGVKADYPPTEAQLVDYFKTLKNDPAGARQAFDDYAKDFHVHPANVPGADFDVKYSQDKVVTKGTTDVTTSVPDDWSEVSNRSPGPNAKPESIGKQMNDCEGFAFMAEKLLGAAGFKLEGHVTVEGNAVGEHAMTLFTHPPEKGFTVTSNDRTFTGATAKGAAKEGFGYAIPQRPVLVHGKPVKGDDDQPKMEPAFSGKEKFYTGKTMQDSQVAGQTGGAQLK